MNKPCQFVLLTMLVISASFSQTPPAGTERNSGVSFIPVADVSTHTFGASIELRPGEMNFAKIGRLSCADQRQPVAR
jgi:hypothetical protein